MPARWAALLTCVAMMPGALAGGGGLIDPAELLRTSGQVRHLEAVATASSAQRVRLSWGTRPVPVDVIFASEATAAAQAQLVRRVTVTVQSALSRPLTPAQRQAVERVAAVLGAACLGPSRAVTYREASDGPVTVVTVTLDARDATPRCRMPAGR